MVLSMLNAKWLMIESGQGIVLITLYLELVSFNILLIHHIKCMEASTNSTHNRFWYIIETDSKYSPPFIMTDLYFSFLIFLFPFADEEEQREHESFKKFLERHREKQIEKVKCQPKTWEIMFSLLGGNWLGFGKVGKFWTLLFCCLWESHQSRWLFLILK